MCGLVGIITKSKYGFQKLEQRMFYQMLYADALRGVDATGVITVSNNGDFGTMKEASNANSFLDGYVDSDLDKDLFKNGFAVVGHNRSSTVGADVDENAHPFVEDGTFALVHNGTLYNHKALADTAVDSHALAITIKNAFDAEDYKTALEDALKKVYGAYACIWFDQKREQIGIVRNKDRPLFIAETAKNILISSESGLANWISGRNGEKVTKIASVPEDTLITFALDGGGVAVHTPLTLKSPTPSWVGNHKHQHGGHRTASTEESKDKESPFRSFVHKKSNQLPCISKNGFKKYKKQSVGDFLKFKREDYAKSPNSTTTYNMWGKGNDITFKHVVRCVIDREDYNINELELDFLDDWEGFIQDCHYAKDGTVTIFLELPSIAASTSSLIQ